MFDISEWAADVIYDWSNVLLLVAAVFVLLGTFGAIWSDGVRDKYATIRGAEHAEKIAAAQKGAAQANEAAAKANEGLAKANLDIEQRKQESLKMELQLETEKRDRLELQERLRMRFFDINEIREVLKDFKEVSVLLENVRDKEATQAATNLGFAIRYAGLKLESWNYTDENIVSGIFVQANERPVSDDDKSAQVQSTLVEYLKKEGLKAGAIPTYSSEQFPKNTIKISVGPSEIYEISEPLRIRAPQEAVWSKGPQEPPSKPTNENP